MNEEKDYSVLLSIEISTVVSFAPMERVSPITELDAIDNAIGSLPPGWLTEVEDAGFSIDYPINGEAELI